MAPIVQEERVDWFRTIVDLERNGYSHQSIASSIGVGKRTVGGWKAGATPKYDDGELLLTLWSMVTKNGRESAHKVTRYSFRA